MTRVWPLALTAALVAAAATAAVAMAAADSPADARLKAVAPFVDDQTLVVGHIDLPRVNIDRLLDFVAGLIPAEAREVREAKAMAGKMRDGLVEAGAKEAYVLLSLAQLHQPGPLVVVPLAKDADAEAVTRIAGGLLKGSADSGQIKTFRTEGALLIGPPATVDRARTMKAMPRPELAAAFAAAKDLPARVLVVPPPHLARVVDEIMPQLPKEIGGGPSKTVTEGVRWLAVGASSEPLHVEAVLQSRDAASARAFQELLGRVLAKALEQPGVREAVPELAALQRVLKPTVEGDRLVLSVPEKDLTEAVKPLLARARENAARAVQMNGMKQMLLAMHNYLSTYDRFPASYSRDKQGRPLLSWRVHLLPYLDQVELYKQFKLDEPWDSEHNKKLVARMPAVFASADAKLNAAGRTLFVVPTGKDTPFPPDSKGLKIKDFQDGTSNTVILLQTDPGRAVVWTSPEDLAFDFKKPQQGLYIRPDGKFLAGFADGSVRFIRKTVSDDTLRHLITPAGGEVIGNDL